MTSIKTSPVYSTTARRSPDGRPKAVLFCSSCGHESPVSGDWVVERAEESETYRCPDCHTVISSRTDTRDSDQ